MWYVQYWIIWTLDFSQKLFSGDYLFVFTSNENTDVVLIQPNPESSYTQEPDMPYDEEVDTMVDDMLDEIE